MPQNVNSTQVQIMDLSPIMEAEERIIGIIGEEGLPPLVITNKFIYKILFGKGIIMETGEVYETYNQTTKEFDFSINHPIFKNSFGIVQCRAEKELKILTYSIMEELASILKIKNYIEEQWEKISSDVFHNIEKFEVSSQCLPLIPFLKESVDGFFVECKNILSYILTLFKIYYQKKTIIARNPYCNDCLKDINKPKFHSIDKNGLQKVFNNLQSFSDEMRAIRNAINHPENFKENKFLLYNVYWGNHKKLCPPLFEYQSMIDKNIKKGEKDVIVYFDNAYVMFLNIVGNFLKILIKDIDNNII